MLYSNAHFSFERKGQGNFFLKICILFMSLYNLKLLSNHRYRIRILKKGQDKKIIKNILILILFNRASRCLNRLSKIHLRLFKTQNAAVTVHAHTQAIRWEKTSSPFYFKEWRLHSFPTYTFIVIQNFVWRNIRKLSLELYKELLI